MKIKEQELRMEITQIKEEECLPKLKETLLEDKVEAWAIEVDWEGNPMTNVLNARMLIIRGRHVLGLDVSIFGNMDISRVIVRNQHTRNRQTLKSKIKARPSIPVKERRE
jgi:hypothetical protein